jgi:ribose 5-phosphate isomerase B
MRIAVGATNRGLAVRDQIVHLLRDLGHDVAMMEMPEGQPGEYPDISASVARQIRAGKAERGILIGWSGMGMCIVANRFSGVRAAVCFDEFMTELGRRYLDVNVLCLSADLVGEEPSKRIVEAWLKAPFEGGRHARRISRISEIEREG